MNIIEATKKLESITGIESARAWTKVPGKERIYLDTIKRNGGKNWNGGLGYAQCYIDLSTRTVVMRGEAGASTRKWHAENNTKEQIQAIAESI